MTLYEERLAQDLRVIRGKIQDISDRVCAALQDAVDAAKSNDQNVLNDIVLEDYDIGRDIRYIDKLCHEFVAKHLPAAGHLRFISAVLRLTIALERAGDYAVTISRVVLQLQEPLSSELLEKARSMAAISTKMLADATKAFLSGEPKLAAETKKLDFQVDKSYDEVFEALVQDSKTRDPRQLLSLLKIFSKVERFSDQAKNICEEAIFAATGQQKPPKTVRVLFLDKENDYLSKIAESLANKAFPVSGIYSSAGLEPATEFQPSLAEVGNKFGLEIIGRRPGRVGNLNVFPIPFHIVVAINTGDDPIPSLAYHTILRRWDVQKKGRHETLIHDLSSRVRKLIEKVRGHDAD